MIREHARLCDIPADCISARAPLRTRSGRTSRRREPCRRTVRSHVLDGSPRVGDHFRQRHLQGLPSSPPPIGSRAPAPIGWPRSIFSPCSRGRAGRQSSGAKRRCRSGEHQDPLRITLLGEQRGQGLRAPSPSRGGAPTSRIIAAPPEIGQCRRIVLLLGGELTQIGSRFWRCPTGSPPAPGTRLRRLFVASTSFQRYGRRRERHRRGD
mgnify:CR=1 FL=1